MQAGIMKVMEKYVEAQKLAAVYSCFPESVFAGMANVKKQAIAARVSSF